MARAQEQSDFDDRDQSEYDDPRTRESNEQYESRRSSGSGFTAARWLAVFVLFIAFMFMAFAAATPVTNKFYIFSVSIKVNALIIKVTDEFMFGVWGYCSSGVKDSFGIGKAKINTKLSKGSCHDRQLGWTFKDVPGMSDQLQDAITEAVTFLFLLHIVSAVCIFLGLLFMVVSAAKRDISGEVSRYRDDGSDYDVQDVPKSRKSVRRLAFTFIAIAFAFTMGTFILDLAGVLLTKKKIHNKSKGAASLGFGPAFWFVVATFGLVIIAFIISLADSIRSGKSATSRNYNANVDERSSSSNYSHNDQKYNENEMDDVNLDSPQDERKRY